MMKIGVKEVLVLNHLCALFYLMNNFMRDLLCIRSRSLASNSAKVTQAMDLI